MILTNKNTDKVGVKKRTIEQSVKIGPLSLKFITLLIFAALTLFYLAQSTQSATKKYQLRELQVTQSQLEEDRETLEAEALRLKSLKEIETKIEKLELKPAEETVKN
ncbi:MAG: hypothetical protein UR93_C0006G0015 [Berkelbacteria bacterium GW2011_GWA2_35_9]|uniref:Cell division protein FtsL n=1 Tax=Berkelbacteria bacterium GW2011_GWA2_35_9 TaxID=1618333 RepID=A0A0G0GAY6_9BACT|nr:MAG: hypothetical protein UR93_C0006G0015 [Berkelbacteria bacterium GW2011_GWA2_35_9]